MDIEQLTQDIDRMFDERESIADANIKHLFKVFADRLFTWCISRQETLRLKELDDQEQRLIVHSLGIMRSMEKCGVPSSISNAFIKVRSSIAGLALDHQRIYESSD